MINNLFVLLIFLFISFCMVVIIHFSVVVVFDLYHRYIRNIYPFCKRGDKHEK